MKNIDLLGLPLIKCHHKKYESYTLYSDNDNYIIGKGNVDKNYISNTTSTDMLMNYLKLSAELRNEGLLQSMLIEKDDIIKASVIIIKYCNKYGLLMIEDDIHLPKYVQFNGFEISGFIYRLLRLSKHFFKEASKKNVGDYNMLPFMKTSITFSSIMYDETDYSFNFEAKDLITLVESQAIIYAYKESKDIVEGYIKYSKKNNDFYIAKRKTRMYQGINGDTKQNAYNKSRRKSEPETHRLHNRIYQRLYQRGMDTESFTSQSSQWRNNVRKGKTPKEDYIKWLQKKDLETK